MSRRAARETGLPGCSTVARVGSFAACLTCRRPMPFAEAAAPATTGCAHRRRWLSPSSRSTAPRTPQERCQRPPRSCCGLCCRYRGDGEVRSWHQYQYDGEGQEGTQPSSRCQVSGAGCARDRSRSRAELLQQVEGLLRSVVRHQEVIVVAGSDDVAADPEVAAPPIIRRRRGCFRRRLPHRRDRAATPPARPPRGRRSTPRRKRGRRRARQRR